MKTTLVTMLVAICALAASPVLSQDTTDAGIQVSKPEGAVAPEGFVESSTFTTSIVDRAPQDTIATLGNDHNKIFYFTDVRNMTGQTLTHRWEFNGQVMAEVTFEIGGPRWRVNSSKMLEPVWLGEWTASAVDASGRTLSSNTFSYTHPKPEPKAMAPKGTIPDPAVPAAPDK
jgi:hypothetical protein